MLCVRERSLGLALGISAKGNVMLSIMRKEQISSIRRRAVAMIQRSCGYPHVMKASA